MTSKGSAITDELRSLIGRTQEPEVLEVERGAIKRFCEAVGDTNPLFTDIDYARKGPYGDVVCPPGFFGWPAKPRPMVAGLLATLIEEFAKAGFHGVLDGGIEYEFSVPIHPGDVLVSSSKMRDIYEREGRTGKSLFGVIETTYTNQNGNIVATARMTFIGRRA